MYRGERREPAVVLLLSLVTCGLYGLWSHYKVAGEIQEALGRTGELSPGTEVLLIIITCGIYGIYWWYKYGKLVAELRQQRGLPPNDNAILYLLLVVFAGIGGLINPMLMQGDLNRVWEAV